MSFITRTLFSVISLIVSLAIVLSSCKVEPNKVAPTPWPSLKFAGNFSGNDICLIAGSQSNSITVMATDTTKVNITNLYGTGKVFKATISNDTCTIPPQVYNNGTGNALMQGLYVITGDTITLSIIVSTFGQEDKCNAVLIKQ